MVRRVVSGAGGLDDKGLDIVFTFMRPPRCAMQGRRPGPGRLWPVRGRPTFTRGASMGRAGATSSQRKPPPTQSVDRPTEPPIEGDRDRRTRLAPVSGVRFPLWMAHSRHPRLRKRPLQAAIPLVFDRARRFPYTSPVADRPFLGEVRREAAAERARCDARSGRGPPSWPGEPRGSASDPVASVSQGCRARVQEEPPMFMVRAIGVRPRCPRSQA